MTSPRLIHIIQEKEYVIILLNYCWSLIKIDGKWLPFDATWGIFSGKLPVTLVFKQFESKGAETLSYDKLKFEQIFVQGNII